MPGLSNPHLQFVGLPSEADLQAFINAVVPSNSAINSNDRAAVVTNLHVIARQPAANGYELAA